MFALAAGVNLVELPAGPPGGPGGTNGFLQWAASRSSWSTVPDGTRFSPRIDGRRSVARIVADEHLNLARTKKQLRDTLDRKLLVRVAN